MEFIVYTYELGFVPQLFSKEYRNEHKGNRISTCSTVFLRVPTNLPSSMPRYNDFTRVSVDCATKRIIA